MSLVQKIIELDNAYLDTFSTRMDTAWGHLFFNENQPNYYDANHALIYKTPVNSKSVIDEVSLFYLKKKLVPRFYIYNLEKQTDLIQVLKNTSFRYEVLEHPVQIWNHKVSEPLKKGPVTMEEVTLKNYDEAVKIECSIKELGGSIREKAFAEEFKHQAFTHYLLRYDGTACSTACIFEHENKARLENVATLESFRGKGLIGELIKHLQLEVTRRGIEDFWVFPITERVANVYARYGFETAGNVAVGHAFLAGKSIQEIRDGL